MREIAYQFGETGTLVGILTANANPAAGDYLPAFVILNSGLVHRVGPNRLSVKIARKLSEIGYTTFRIDISGVGDSPVQHNFEGSILERWKAETRSAMNFLAAETGIDRFIFLGNCSGAALSFFSALVDDRVIGAVLINIQGEKKLINYFIKLAISNSKIWRRLISGTVQYHDFLDNFKLIFKKRAGRSTVPAYAKKDFFKDLRTLVNRGLRIIFIHSEWDPGLPYFNKILKGDISKLSHNTIEMKLIRGINHDFNLLKGQNDLVAIITDWAYRNIENLKCN
jgi:pimeloyl-ACP methyl ester carboxylesterase